MFVIAFWNIVYVSVISFVSVENIGNHDNILVLFSGN